MRQIALVVIAVLMMAVQLPAFAADMTPQQRDECLLAAKGCAAQVDSIQQKMRKLQSEIKKGKKVYSSEELKRLNDKLAEAEKMLDNMLRP